MSNSAIKSHINLTDPALQTLYDPLFPNNNQLSQKEKDAMVELISPLFENLSDKDNCVPVRTITIFQPQIKTENGRSRLSAKIDVSGDMREIWFEVEEKYGKYLCYERSDAFLVGLLSWAMRERCDFVCKAPIGEELFYQITTYLIPSVVNASKTLYAPKISAEIDTGTLPNAGAVGTGISCGIDSLHVVANQWKSKYPHLRLTHLILNNVGSFFHDDEDKQLHWHQNHAGNFAKEYGFEFIKTNSNFAEAFPQNHLLTHTYSSSFSILVLQKLWSVYFYASSGYDFTQFRLKKNENASSDHYDILALDTFSSRALKIYSEGGAKTRFEKTRMLIDFVPAQKYLHVCTSDTGGNCNICGKCRRTLVTLDALDALDKFTAVFDINYYKKHRRQYLRWLAEQQISPHGDLMVKEPFEILRKDISIFIWAEACVAAAVKFPRSFLAGIPCVRAFYRKYIKRSKK